ncbi:hypothetical protein WJX72_010377 [[Myrmecia] bisecta]|uniref:Cilia- and flagella-associated protein 45 n=1 Tax=[Myrmecia] bisecta TaxID=41462 RepID=A0AAW1PUK0_9CHLO
MSSTKLGSDNSRNSLRSTRSGYRTINKTSTIDESLFASVKAAVKNADKLPAKATLTKKTGGLQHTIPADVVTLKKADLERMKRPAEVMSAEEIAQLRREAENRNKEERAHANERKTMMLKMEEERKRREPPSETEALKKRADYAMLSRAEQMLQEERDEVKHMNQMVQYSKCVTIRDAQIDEKKHMMREEEEEERALDLAMEIDRIKALDAYEERERQRVVERKRGAEVLAEQIAERERERIRLEEIREQERLQMNREIERVKLEEMAAAVEKQRQAEQLMEEVQRSNAEQMARKKVAKVKEAEEDALIAEYIREKELREAALAEERVRVAKEKELETARLRAKQERAADRQAEIDELRARRYSEAYEREWRTKERAARQRAEAINRDLTAAREAQQAARVRAQAEMAAVESEEFQRVLEENRREEQKKIQLQMAAMGIRERHKEELRAQIQANEERRKREHEEYLLEGKATRERLAQERALIESIKQRKLEEMQADGVPAKYRAELARKKVGEWK